MLRTFQMPLLCVFPCDVIISLIIESVVRIAKWRCVILSDVNVCVSLSSVPLLFLMTHYPSVLENNAIYALCPIFRLLSVQTWATFLLDCPNLALFV